MKNQLKFTFNALTWAMLLLAIYTIAAHAQTGATSTQHTAKQGSVQPSGTNQAVTGSGTPGQITKWTGSNGSSFVLGDSAISEDKFGKVGIGTNAPTSRLTVQGMIETTLGGLKFPDGSVQMTAAVGGLQSIFHDTTLMGKGTAASPLGIAVPLTLTWAGGNTTFTVTSADSESAADAISASGGNSSIVRPGDGIRAQGGNDTSFGSTTNGGYGIRSRGGDSRNSMGGAGVVATGGRGLFLCGDGIQAYGGSPENIGPGGTGSDGAGGAGVTAIGGDTLLGQMVEEAVVYLQEPVPVLMARSTVFAGYFDGAVEVSGSFNVTGGGTKNFKIDHPLDPENKYLYHAAIESSEVLNIYSGNVTTDESGEATVTLPDWFEAVNRDFRYQLTVVGTFAQAIVANKVKGNRFTVKTNAPNVEVSWQVTGIRSDAAMLKHPFKAEEDKPKSERGSYLSPDAYDQPETRGVEWARHPQLMNQLKARKEARSQQSKPASDN